MALFAASALAQEQGNALSVFNAFIARYSSAELAWRSDSRLVSDPEASIPPGYIKGSSAFGNFVYRPKLFSELTKAEQRAVIRDPRLSAFVEALRSEIAMEETPADASRAIATVRTAGATEIAAGDLETKTGRRDPGRLLQIVEVSAADVLSPAPVRIYLP
jgi:hypothetical protein